MSSKAYYIALNTYRESIRSKILYSLMFFAVLLVCISAFFGTVTIGDQVKVIKDFGLFSISLFTVAYSVISGSALLYKELSRKTVYNILARPVHRWQFLCGKYFGMLMTATVMLFLMGVGFSIFVMLFEGKFDLLLGVAYLHILFELMIVCAATIFFSALVVTPMLSGLFSFGVFLAGRSAGLLLYFINDGSVSGLLSHLLRGLYAVLPHLEMLNVNDNIVYGIAPPVKQVVLSGGYAALYGVTLLVLANLIFRSREFN